MPRQARDQYLQVDGACLRYRDEGGGPAIVLVHGWTLDLEMWDPQVARLCNAFRLVRLDRRGHGLSTGTAGAGRDASDLDCLCRHLALESVAAIGMSQGVRGVLGFAAAAPTRLRALILDGPPALESATSDEDVPLSHYRSVIHTQGIESFRREWECHPLMQLRTRDPAMRTLLRAMLERYAGRDLMGPAGEPVAPSPSVALESIATPTLIVNGEWDVASRIAYANHLSERLPHADRAFVAGAGHLPNLDSPDIYSELCRSFLTLRLLSPAVS